MKRFGRVWELQVGSQIYTSDMDFRATHRRGAPAECRIEVYGPPRALIDAVSAEDIEIRVLAGWEDSGPVEVARGGVVRDSLQTSRSSSTPRASWSITSARGSIREPILSRSWPPQAAATDILRDIAGAAGLSLDVIRLGVGVTYLRGYVASGRMSPVLDAVCADAEAQWIVADGRLRVWPIGSDARRTAEVWSPATGLLQLTASGGGLRRLTVSALLTPHLRPGDVVRVDDADHGGDVVVEEVDHAGQSSGGSWITRVVGSAYAP